jgi:hypothetical protein
MAALMLALSSPVFAEGGVTGKSHTSAYTGVNKTDGYTYNRTTGEDQVTTNFMDNRRYGVNADNNGLMGRTERAVSETGRTVRGTVRAAATDNGNDFDWGWLGLLGLIGLAGLRGRNRQTS